METCSCSRASPPSSHLRGTDLWFSGCAGVVPPCPSCAPPLWIPACAGMTSGWRGNDAGLERPPRLGNDRLACYGFVGASSYLSASEPYSYNDLRNRVFRQRFAHLHSSERKTSFSGCGGTPPAGRVLATPCYPARCLTSFNCACYVLKGCAHPSRRGDSSKRSGRPSPRGAPNYCYTTDVVRMSNVIV